MRGTSKGLRPINANCRCPLCQKTPKAPAPVPSAAAKALLDAGIDGIALDQAVVVYRRQVPVPPTPGDHAAISRAISAYLEACAGSLGVRPNYGVGS